MEALECIKIVLGSKSPRRKQLLESAGFNIRVLAKEVDESYPEDMNLSEVAEYLAIKKAKAFHNDDVLGDEILVTADSVVIKENVFFGKPDDRAHAIDMLTQLQGAVHQVYTGVCIRKGNEMKSFSEKADVKFANMNQDEICYYVDAYQPFDKAGSYGVQDWIGLCKVEWMNGTFANIMGLPVHRIYQEIMEFRLNDPIDKNNL